MDPLSAYTHAASRSAATVIGEYSTSFGWACRLLPAPARRDIAAIYALVRVADEAVDGAAAAAGLSPEGVGEELDRLEADTVRALATGYSTNLVVHAFAEAARRHGITPALTAPFFASMRADLSRSRHGAESLRTYIYGSAEVVGLMCLQVFRSLPGTARGRDPELEAAARRLGAAFQKVNFLRDLAADRDVLGRTYLPGTAGGEFGEQAKEAALADIRGDLAAAAEALPLLDPGARRATALAHALFTELADRIGSTPAPVLATRRVRVGGPRKAWIAARTLAAASAARPATAVREAARG